MNLYNILLGTPQISSGLDEMETLIVFLSLLGAIGLFFLVRFIIGKVKAKDEVEELDELKEEQEPSDLEEE